MQWLRNVFARKATQPTQSTRPNAFRPNLETLGARDLPSVSSVITAAGQYQFIVDTTNKLVVVDPSGVSTTTSFTNIRTAQGFLDKKGGLGADIVFVDGSAQHIETANGFNFTLTNTQFGKPILDMGTAYDSKGNVRIDILVSNTTSTSNDIVGTLQEFTTAGGLQPVGLTNVRWVSTYQATDGSTGIAVGLMTTGGMLLAEKLDSVNGLAVLYNNPDGVTENITEYTQAVAPATFGKPAVVIIDVTFGRFTGTNVLEFSTGKFGASTAVPNVVYVTAANPIKVGG